MYCTVCTVLYCYCNVNVMYSQPLKAPAVDLPGGGERSEAEVKGTSGQSAKPAGRATAKASMSQKPPGNQFAANAAVPPPVSAVDATVEVDLMCACVCVFFLGNNLKDTSPPLYWNLRRRKEKREETGGEGGSGVGKNSFFVHIIVPFLCCSFLFLLLRW